ncbi:alpha/beta hydrolase [Clavibacter sp. Sh2141]|uniref:alpha/beta hydrolase n=1 Tax=Clavibacter sp. Sh2141 TaxID=3395374 RepID=UPI0039BC62FB
MSDRTAVPIRSRLLWWAGREFPEAARALRGSQAAGTTVDRRTTGEQGPPLDLDVWLPPDHDLGKTGSPVVVVFPRIRGDWLPSTLAKELRAVVVSMPTDDDALALAGMRWIAARTAGWNGTPERLGVLGDGPGADLALRVTATARDTGGPSVLRLVLVSPSGTLPAGDIAADDSSRTGSGPRGLRDLPSNLIHTGAADPRHRRLVAAVSELRAAGVKSRLVTLPNADRGWLALPRVDPQLTRRSLDEIVAFLRRGLTEEREFGTTSGVEMS